MSKIDGWQIFDYAWKLATGIGLTKLYFWAKKNLQHYKKNREQWRVLMLDIINDLKFGQRSTWEMLGLAVWESDAEGKVTFVSPGLCSMVGCNTEDMLGNNWINQIAEESREKVYRNWKFSLENASDFCETYVYIKEDGMLQKIRANIMHNKDNEGKVISSKGYFLKIGEPYKK